MGQQANNRGRQAALDEKKQRAAGRRNQNSPEREAIKDSVGVRYGKNHPVGGAHGKRAVTSRQGDVDRRPAGGDQGEPADRAAASTPVGASTKRTRRRR